MDMKKTYIAPNMILGQNEISHSVICASYDFGVKGQSGNGGDGLGGSDGAGSGNGMGYGGNGNGDGMNGAKHRGFYEAY